MDVGDIFPHFTLQDEDGETLDSRMLDGIRYVIYFYPKDGTAGCKKEALGFTDAYAKFIFRNIPIFGVSRDSVASHRRFKDDNNLKIKLLSDPDHALTEEVGAWGKKMMYGKEVEGVIRSTFIVGKDGRIEAVWAKVKVDGHADVVLDKAVSLFKKS